MNTRMLTAADLNRRDELRVTITTRIADLLVLIAIKDPETKVPKALQDIGAIAAEMKEIDRLPIIPPGLAARIRSQRAKNAMRAIAAASS